MFACTPATVKREREGASWRSGGRFEAIRGAWVWSLVQEMRAIECTKDSCSSRQCYAICRVDRTRNENMRIKFDGPHFEKDGDHNHCRRREIQDDSREEDFTDI